MRQLCNVAFVARVENMDDDEFERFLVDLETPPGERPRYRSKVDPGFLGFLGGPA